MYLLFVLSIPILTYFLYPTIGLPGAIVLTLLWVVFIVGLFSHLRATKVYCEITDKGIEVCDGKDVVRFDMTEVRIISTQVVISKRLGLYESFPYLVLQIEEKSKEKLDSLSSSKEFGFIQKRGDLVEYMGKERGDIYILINLLKKADFTEIESILKGSLKPLSPLVKTTEEEEYNKVVEDVFDK
jgi:uncharacterized protein YqgQ